ncbi:MAG TPA: hypothetical protein P5555_19235 [Candidatus Paceibacterota bacterium]|nr:hypothetical protein [Candidatus Paceibacterota bacterium]
MKPESILPMRTSHHCHSCISRRQCLQILSSAGVGLAMSGNLVRGLAQSSKPAPDFVDPDKLRPKPKIRLDAAILQQPRPYWLGWPGTAYDLDARQQEYRSSLRESCQRLGIDVREEAKPVEDEAGLAALLNGVKGRKPDGLLVILQHMQCWPWANRLSKEAGVPLIVFSPIGTSFTGHVNNISRQPGVHVVSTLHWPAVENGLRMIRARRLFEESRILWIRGDQRNETVLERLGTKVRAVPRKTFNELFDKMPVNEEVRDLAADFRRGARRVVEPNEEDGLNCVRAYTAAKRLLADEQANALSMDCLGMVGARLVPTPPCGAWTMLQDQGITAGCEADLHGATSMMLTSYLLDRPGYMNDPVAETARNLLIVSHCTSGTRLNGFAQKPSPYILRSHSESALGVAVQVLWPVGEKATLVRFRNPNELILDTGTVVSNVDTPPAGGCRTSVELKMDDIEDCRDVLGFHQVVTLGDHRRIIEGFCQLYGINVVHSPRYESHPKLAA